MAADSVPLPQRNSAYPEPFAQIVAGRSKRKLGDQFGLQNFGVNLTELKRGAASALLHHHSRQDEFIYMFEGKLDLKLNGEDAYASAGDLVRLPRGIPHGIFSNGDRPVKCLFWVSPARRLYDLFWQLHKMGQADPGVARCCHDPI